jgi:hypothetical protein
VALWLIVWLLYMRRTIRSLPAFTAPAAAVPIATGAGPAAASLPSPAEAAADAPVADAPRETPGTPEGGSHEQ